MVAADNGDLDFITMKHQVFKINTHTKLTPDIGKIEGLDANFTPNGAAVDEDGTILLSTATYSGSRARITDMVSLKAVEEKDAAFFNASDLASANLVRTATPTIAKTLDLPERDYEAGISAYPNPVTDGGYTLLQFNKIGTGRYTIDMLSSAGNSVARKAVQITTEGQQVQLSTRSLSKGFYVVKAVEATTKAVYTTKLIVQ